MIKDEEGLGKYLHNLRIARGYSLSSLAKLLDVDEDYMLCLEERSITLDIEDWFKLKKLLEIEDDEIKGFILDEDEEANLEYKRQFKNRKLIQYQENINNLTSILRKNTKQLVGELNGILKFIEEKDEENK